jgi:acyl-CoA hydrolase
VSTYATSVRIVAVALVAFAVACSRTPATAPLPASATVVALGDSLTFGTGATSETSYPAVLAALTGWSVVNAGVPGATAAEGCARLPALLDEHRPQLVIVLLGGNDFLRRMPEQVVHNALGACAVAVRATRTPIVILTVPRLGVGGLSTSPLYAQAGDALAVPVIDSGLADLLSRSSLRADAIHLNAAGYRELAGNVAKGLRKAGFL